MRVNVLSKLDLIQQYGELDFNLDFYTEVQDLSHLENALNQNSPRFAALNMQICSLIEDYGLVGFETLAVEVRGTQFAKRQTIKHLHHRTRLPWSILHGPSTELQGMSLYQRPMTRRAIPLRPAPQIPIPTQHLSDQILTRCSLQHWLLYMDQERTSGTYRNDGSPRGRNMMPLRTKNGGGKENLFVNSSSRSSRRTNNRRPTLRTCHCLSDELGRYFTAFEAHVYEFVGRLYSSYCAE